MYDHAMKTPLVWCKLVFFVAAFVCAALSAETQVWQPSPGHTQIPIWPGAAPDAQPMPGPERMQPPDDFRVAGRPVIGVTNVTQPTMTVYSPEGKNTGVVVVVLPGGGFEGLAMDLEGTEVCDWLTPNGITCVLLKFACRVRRMTGDAIAARTDMRHRRWRWKMCRGPWAWCVRTLQSGISAHTRLE
jgi:hypothetical protein